MEPKNKKGLVIVTIILAICLVGTGGYIVYDKFIVEKDNDTKEEANEKVEQEEVTIEELDVNSEEVVSLYNTITSGILSRCGVVEYFEVSKLNVSELSFSLVADILIKQIYTDKQLNTWPKVGDSFTEEEFDFYMKKYFGESYTYQHETIGVCPKFTYDASLKQYTVLDEPACGGMCPDIDTQKIVRSYKEGDKLVIEVKKAFYKSGQNFEIYKDYEQTQLIGEVDSTEPIVVPDDILEQANTYRFTFVNEDGNYVFKSSELVS